MIVGLLSFSVVAVSYVLWIFVRKRLRALTIVNRFYSSMLSRVSFEAPPTFVTPLTGDAILPGAVLRHTLSTNLPLDTLVARCLQVEGTATDTEGGVPVGVDLALNPSAGFCLLTRKHGVSGELFLLSLESPCAQRYLLNTEGEGEIMDDEEGGDEEEDREVPVDKEGEGVWWPVDATSVHGFQVYKSSLGLPVKGVVAPKPFSSQGLVEDYLALHTALSVSLMPGTVFGSGDEAESEGGYVWDGLRQAAGWTETDTETGRIASKEVDISSVEGVPEAEGEGEGEGYVAGRMRVSVSVAKESEEVKEAGEVADTVVEGEVSSPLSTTPSSSNWYSTVTVSVAGPPEDGVPEVFVEVVSVRQRLMPALRLGGRGKKEERDRRPRVERERDAAKAEETPQAEPPLLPPDVSIHVPVESPLHAALHAVTAGDTDTPKVPLALRLSVAEHGYRL
ncbi:hypothetical protein KIPB_007906 [Kipferlia bialata]|uniref:Uncharacterized protein n=1 Tax=Kipferlia bialata TaxID=797122 RepID=A0A9K3CZQ4_9EUKA|nr:hypothetical protein KIPB_005428 [Kipferlia bialata]GIQ86116.1 hypothetical protein KIPB_007906 [Kipferlia bialata]|eukprot:g5428.t1